MRKLLIISQAAVLTFLAVYGAQGGTTTAGACPLPAPQATSTCDF